jgi:hypothetical protein
MKNFISRLFLEKDESKLRDIIKPGIGYLHRDVVVRNRDIHERPPETGMNPYGETLGEVLGVIGRPVVQGA